MYCFSRYHVSLLLMGMLSVSLHATTGSWSFSASNLEWDNNSNWTNTTYPNGVGEVAAFIGAPGTEVITSSSDITIGSLHLDIPERSLTIGFSSNSITFDNDSTTSDIFVASGQTHFFDTPAVLNNDLFVHGGNSASLSFSKEISGTGALIAVADAMSFHTQLDAENSYTGGTFVQSGFLQLNGPTNTTNVPGAITVLGSGSIDHSASNTYASTSDMTISGGIVYLHGTSQTLNSLVMNKRGAIYDTLPGGTLTLESSAEALIIGGDSGIHVNEIIISNGGSILNDSSNPGHAFFQGHLSPNGVMTVDLNGNTDVRINADFNGEQGQNSLFEIDFNNVAFVNGTLEKTGSATVLFEGMQSELPDMVISNGTVRLGRHALDIIASNGVMQLLEGTSIQGFGTFGTAGLATVVNTAGGVLPGMANAFMPGVLTVSGNYIQTSQGMLGIVSMGVENSSQLKVVDGSVTLNGTLFFLTVPSFTLNDGDEIVVVDNTLGTGISGSFSNLFAILPADLSASVIYESHRVLVRISTCTQEPSVLPPSNAQGTQFENHFATYIDIINRISWEASSTPDVVKYNIYRNGMIIGSVLASDSLQFDDHYRAGCQSYLYAVTAVNSSNEESAPLLVTFPCCG